MGELYEGPVQLWTPDEETQELIAQLEVSDSPLDQAYAEAYKNACWIREFGTPGTAENAETGMTTVGDLHTLVELELRCNTEIDVSYLTIYYCVDVAHHGSGATRAERVLDGMRQVIADRERSAE